MLVHQACQVTKLARRGPTQPLSAKLVLKKIDAYFQKSLKNNGNKQLQFLHLLTPNEIMVMSCMGMEYVYGEEWKALYDRGCCHAGPTPTAVCSRCA